MICGQRFRVQIKISAPLLEHTSHAIKHRIHSDPSCSTRFRSFISLWASPQCRLLGCYNPNYSHYPPPTCIDPLLSFPPGSTFQLEAPQSRILRSKCGSSSVGVRLSGLLTPANLASKSVEELMPLLTICCRSIGDLHPFCVLEPPLSRTGRFGDDEEATQRW